MTYYRDRLSAIVGDLVECMCDRLAVEGAGPLCFCGLMPGGAVAWDYCGQCSGATCGMGYVTVVTVYPYESFPEQSAYSKCDRPLAATLTIGALRCAPIPAEDGTLPGEVEQTEAALAAIADMDALYSTIVCCKFAEVSVGAYIPLAAAGGCMGGAWELTVALDGY